MLPVLPVLLKDGYKVGHKFQYPTDTTRVYSNLTARSSRLPGVNGVVSFGFQYFVREFLHYQFNTYFFNESIDDVLAIYNRRIASYLGPIDASHIGNLHDLGYLPLRVKALPEGSFVPLRVPLMTIENTHDDFYWLTNMLETLLSAEIWPCITAATIAREYLKKFLAYAERTGGNPSFVQWQGHDFSMRGMMGIEAAMKTGAGHLLSFTGSDTIPAIDFLEEYYNAYCELELVAGSVPATEHSVMSVGMQDGEFETFKRLLTEVYPTGIVSIVSDTWDFYRVLSEYLPRLREVVLSRDGKLVIRPDSGDPVKIICGDPSAPDGPARKGAIRMLYEVFGGTSTSTGHVVLDPHIGLIYGDSITLERQEEILSRLAAQGFASTNVVLGIGSYTYQHVTRDTFGLAMKATYAETRSRGALNIFKKPVTDDGTKNSATGLLCVKRDLDGQYRLFEKCSREEEAGPYNDLETIFLDGDLFNQQTLAQVRARLRASL